MPNFDFSPFMSRVKGNPRKFVTLISCLTLLFSLGLCSRAFSKESRTAPPKASSTKRILVAYFSHSGNTRELAQQIHRKVGGELFEIVTVNPYPRDYHAVVEQAQQEQNSGYRPRLKTKIKNLKPYEVVFIGYPNWWGTMPMPLFTFLSEYDFSGKIIVPFCTHEGSRLGRSVEDITTLCPRSTILEGLAVRGGAARNAQEDVSEWLRKIEAVE